MKRIVATLVILFGMFCDAVGQGSQIVIEAPHDAFVDVYFAINLRGKVFVTITNEQGSACAKFWWIKWPFGNTGSLPNVCGAGEFEIPTLPNIAAKLRAQSLSGDVKIVVKDQVEVLVNIGKGN